MLVRATGSRSQAKFCRFSFKQLAAVIAGGVLSCVPLACGSHSDHSTPTVTLTANPTSIIEGASTTLTWSSTNATACTASGSWSGSQSTSGTATETPTAAGTATYNLSCSGSGGNGNASAAVTVGTPAAPTVTIAVAPTTITVGGSSTLTWSSTNATACTASGAWSGTQATSGTATETPAAAGTDTYTLTCTGAGGSANGSATLTVNAAAVAPTALITVNPTTITLGGTATLTWSSTNATACTASGAWSGAEATSGTQSVTPTAVGTDSYEITCTGSGGSASSTATLTVNTPAPVVTIGISPTTIAVGSSATLTWSATNATSCTASGAWSGSEATSGTATETPTQAGTDTYTLACTGSGGTDTKSATLTVNAPASQAFVYTINSPLNTNLEGNISAYSESAADGTLTLLPGSPYNTGLVTPYAVAVDQPLNLLFAIGGTGSGQPTGEIVEYAINPTTGALTSMTTTTPPDDPTSLVIGPSGNFLYVTSHGSSAVMAYSIAANGTLTAVSGSPFAVPATNCGAFCENTADQIVYDSQEGTLYVDMDYSWYVATFTVNSTTGVLTWVNNGTGVQCGPSSVSLDTTGKFVYVTDACSANVNGFTATTSDTSEPLTPIAGSPFAAGGTPNGSVAEPTGKYFYVLNSGDNTVSGYTVNSTSGALTQLGSSPFAITDGTTSPNQIIVDPSGLYLYVSSADYNGSEGGLTQFSINLTTGNLTQVSSTPILPGTNANSPAGVAVYKKP